MQKGCIVLNDVTNLKVTLMNAHEYANMGLTEFLIAFSVIMLMLTLISERLANFLKIHFQDKMLIIPFLYYTIDNQGEKKWHSFLKVNLEIIANKQPSRAMEKEREYRILIINIIIGIIIAIFTNANFFEIISTIKKGTPELGVIGWDVGSLGCNHIWGFAYLTFFFWSISIVLMNRLVEVKESGLQINKNLAMIPFVIWIIGTFIMGVIGFNTKGISVTQNIVLHGLGFMFTGLFLSLGSKFWHDLLDVLFKIKSTRQNLSNPGTFTNNNSADAIQELTEISQYEIADKLFAEYKDEIAAIGGVVSYGLNSVKDTKNRMYKRIIEVEFTTTEAQQKLIALQNEASIKIKLNTFYLKDYMVLLLTEPIKALVDNAIFDNPVCYAYNMDSPNNVGSFWVYKEPADGDYNYFAVSNLHVLATPAELKKCHDNNQYKLQSLEVTFVIGENRTKHFGTIFNYKFGDYSGYGEDLAICNIKKELYDAYFAIVNKGHLESVPKDTMRMFGGVSKYNEYYYNKEYTPCEVDYGRFEKKMYLVKIKSKYNGPLHGDSGAVIHYKKDNGTLATGILVASSSNYTYMFNYILS